MRLGQRALDIQQQALGPEHADLASSLSVLAGIHYAVGDYQKAGEMMARVNHLLAKAYGAKHPILADGLTSLGEIERLRDRPGKAEQAYRQAADILLAGVGADTPRLATVYNNWAALEQSRGAYNAALGYYRRSSAILTNVLGAAHPALAAVASGEARVHASKGDLEQALSSIRRASSIVEKRFRAIRGRALSPAALAELAQARDVFIQHLGYLAKSKTTNSTGASQSRNLTDESFKLAQLARATGTEGSLGQMAARFASGSDGLAQLVRSRQDLLEKQQTLTGKLTEALGQPKGNRNSANEASVRSALIDVNTALETIENQLSKEFPEYAEFSNPQAVTVNGIQQILRPKEVLMTLIVGESQSYVWAISPSRATFEAIDLTAEQAAAKVAQLRKGLDPMGGAPTDKSGLPATYPGRVAYDLQNRLFGKLNAVIKGASLIHIIADGAFESLPFQALLTAPPVKPLLKSADFASAPWMIKKYAVSYLPAISSLRALRRYARATKAHLPFLGVGDPILANHPLRNKRKQTSKVAMARNLLGGGFENRQPITTRGLFRSGLADISMLNLVPSLPETADELEQMRISLGADANSLILRERARERILKTDVDFSRYRVVAFATHGLVAGELQGFNEPALMMTPPSKATVMDDGLLTASEIAKLSFDADLIILSACNTASSSGELGAEGLSGLAKAFFYAGSRALFVSHWAVLSEPTVRLTTTMLRRLREVPGMSRAQAHRESILAMMGDKKTPLYAHPTVWAPFVIVGEGG